MSDKNTQQAAAPVFNIQRIYVKGAVLDMPNAPAIFLEQDRPSIQVRVDATSVKLSEGAFETTVTAAVTARLKDRVAFEATIRQAGIFDIRNVDAAQAEQLLAVSCPSLLFPYLRTSIADLVSRSGFPPIHLADINFLALYQHNQAQRAAQASNEAQSAPSSTDAAQLAARQAA
ncbi:protein-export chaperone SecB [Burkholderia gladioli]|uniref:protein-export chaperone SecB n=1 Tax=Burkholderia gladioli TaxID=28095 RepID=UPI0016409998|nr:protein-export chaperone SecB [Burkholderia gladioli]